MGKTILTGDRPTGPLHIGHLFGSLLNRVKMQDQYETYIMVADVQALTDNFNDPQKVRDNVFNVVMDNLAAGVDPEKSTIFIQSMIPEIAELTVFFSNLVTIARLERNPTVKQEIDQKNDLFKGNVTYGFLGYPVSQAADILVFKAQLVPVGADQLPMIEQAREIAKKFNRIYGQTFDEPQGIMTAGLSRIKGLNGNEKMGKSLNNAVYLADDDKTIEKKVMGALTDIKKIKKNDKGDPSICTVFSYHEIFSKSELAAIRRECRAGERGCVDCKKQLSRNLIKYLEPIRIKRAEYEKNPGLLKKILKDGIDKARDKAGKTMAEVKTKMKIAYKL